MKKARTISSSFILHPSSFTARAFSLIELLLVVAIVGVVAAVAAPRYGDAVNRYRADAAARRIVADLRQIQAKARATGSSRSIGFDSVNHCYLVAGETDLNRSASPYLVRLANDPYYVSIATASFGSGGASISFNGYGVPSSAGFVRIQAGKVTRTVSIGADTGALNVQ